VGQFEIQHTLAMESGPAFADLHVHQNLCVTPAMEAGISDRVWGIEELVHLMGVDPSAA
jgi:hypothetical protein